MPYRHPPFKFEESLDKDLEEIANIANSCFPETFSKEDLKKELMDKKHKIYLAKDRNKVVGFNIWYEDEDDGQVWDWLHAVHPDYRKSGIGSRLMNKLINDTKDMGYSKISLKTYDGFHSMIRFCRRNGFVRTKKAPEIWGENKFAIYFQYNLKNNKKSPMPIPEPKPELETDLYLDVLELDGSFITGLTPQYLGY